MSFVKRRYPHIVDPKEVRELEEAHRRAKWHSFYYSAMQTNDPDRKPVRKDGVA